MTKKQLRRLEKEKETAYIENTTEKQQARVEDLFRQMLREKKALWVLRGKKMAYQRFNLMYFFFGQKQLFRGARKLYTTINFDPFKKEV